MNARPVSVSLIALVHPVNIVLHSIRTRRMRLNVRPVSVSLIAIVHPGNIVHHSIRIRRIRLNARPDSVSLISIAIIIVSIVRHNIRTR